MAKVFKRGKRWGIDYFTAEGVRKREMVAPNKATAEKILQKRLTLVAENKHLDVKRTKKRKFKAFADEYYERHCRRNLQGCHKSARSNVKHLVKYLGGKYLHEIIQRDIEKYVDWRLTHKHPRTNKSIVNNTVNKDLGVLRNMFNKAIEWEYIADKSPMKGFRFLPVDNQRTRFLEKEQIQRLLDNCVDYLRDIVEFALNTGMRQGEIFRLKWHDVDFRRGLIFIMKTKNGEQREIPMNSAVKNVLVRVKKKSDNPYVFASTKGKPFDNVKRSWATALKKSGIENFRFHDLRHTFASQLVMAGVDLMTVKELLGHKRIEMTLRYSHLSSRHKLRAVQSLNLQNPSNVGTYMSHSPTEFPLSTEIPNSYVSK